MFWYFGYGSNMDLRSLRAKGVDPSESHAAVLHGWRLRFNVHHFFRHEGGVGNIEPSPTPGSLVRGVLHRCEARHLALLDAAEAYCHGYDRIELPVETAHGMQTAIAYVGIPSFIDETCRPTQRYLNILIQGAQASGLDPAYIDMLRAQAVHPKEPVSPFTHPAGDYPVFTAETLADHPFHTALAGAVFDMSGARWQHDFLKGFFGGRDMTLFHLKRLDHSDGSETLDDIRLNRLSAAQWQYLNEYLHQYAIEYAYAGRYRYD